MQPDNFVLFLDENIHNCQPVLEGLAKAGIAHQRHGNYFSPGTRDTDWLPFIGNKGWLLVTIDKQIRYNELEMRLVIRHSVREFVFTSGNLSGTRMAELLVKAYPDMVRLCRRIDPPFIASITQTGAVHIRFDRHGSVSKRRKARRRAQGTQD